MRDSFRLALRFVRLVLLAEMAAACTVTHLTPLAPRTLPAGAQPDNPETTLVLRNHRIVTVTKLTVQSDSAIGFIGYFRWAYPLSGIAGVQTEQLSARGTIVTLTAIGAPVYVAAFFIAMHKCGRCS